MRLVRVTGRLGIGGLPVELEPRSGLVALLGDGRAVEAAQALVTQAIAGRGGHRRHLVRDARVRVKLPGGRLLDMAPGPTGDPLRAQLQRHMDLDGESLAMVWAGTGATLESATGRGARLIALRDGLDRVEQILDAMAETPRGAEALAARERTGDAAHVTRGWEPSSATASRLARVERDLRVLRADAAVVQGDLEEATMNWTRERQDAETTLMAYRDRARELKIQLRQMEDAGPGSACPTCGRTLDEQYDSVAAQLREEWESVVQDGQWWRRRREQLELKPQALQDLENRSLRFQATIREAAERAEQLRVELGARTGDGAQVDRLMTAPSPEMIARAAQLADPAGAVVTLTALAREILSSARTGLLSSTSKIMNRLSGGRLVGLDAPEGEFGPLVPRPVAGAPGTEDMAVALVASQLALARSLFRAGLPLESLLLGSHFGDMEEQDQIRGVALLRRHTKRFPQILVLPSAGVVDALPEQFDAVWEFRPAPERGYPALRPLPVGVGRIQVRLTASGV